MEKEGLAGQLDLVFVSMSPGVRDPETLKKVMQAFRNFCYLSTFSGDGWRGCYNDLWHRITGRELESTSWDFIYPFTYVYSLEYRPQIDFTVWSHNRKETIDEAVENIIIFFQCNIHGFAYGEGMGLIFTVLNPASGIASRSRDKSPEESPVGNQLMTISIDLVSSSVRSP